MSVSITELFWQAKIWDKIHPGSGKSEVCSFSILGLSNTQCIWGYIALPKASTRCQQSLEPCLMLLLWSGGEWEGNESEVCQRGTSWPRSFMCISEEKGIIRLEHYWRFMFKTSQRLILYIIWHVSTDCNGTFLLFVCSKWSRVINLEYWAKRANKEEVFGHKWWTLSNKTNSYCGTGIPGSAFWWSSSKVSEYF
jgi:hypothetical protein